MTAAEQALSDDHVGDLIYEPGDVTPGVLALRTLAWAIVAATFVFMINNYLVFWLGWPGISSVLATFGLSAAGAGKAMSGLAWAQVLSYVACLVGPAAYVFSTRHRTMRRDSNVMNAIVTYIIRAAFWAVLFVGLGDMIISFLRVESLLEGVVGADLTKQLGRSQFRGPYVHMPLVGLALVIAAFTRTLGFTWLALLVVVAELQIVVARFIFSYEQAFMGDLVRFWYAALFLFASAYTLYEEGHVRVDVLYARFATKTKGIVNALGSLFLGVSLCIVILGVGMSGKSSIINAPLLNFEVSQSGFGMYVKYMMAGFLGIFAISMMVQFAAYILEGAADHRGDPGTRELDAEIIH
jgi:TRAP-type mannitol/chloroaromatic compound transport system permease small subunit